MDIKLIKLVRVATNLENSGNLKNCQNLREILIFVEKPGKLRENEKYVT